MYPSNKVPPDSDATRYLLVLFGLVDEHVVHLLKDPVCIREVDEPCENHVIPAPYTLEGLAFLRLNLLQAGLAYDSSAAGSVQSLRSFSARNAWVLFHGLVELLLFALLGYSKLLAHEASGFCCTQVEVRHHPVCTSCLGLLPPSLG